MRVAVVGGLVLLSMAISVLAIPSPSPMLHKTNSAEWGLQEPLLMGKEKVEAHHDVLSHHDVVMQAANVVPKAGGHTLIATKDGQPVELKEKHRGKGEHFSRQAKSKHAATHLGDPKQPSKKDVARELRRRLTSEYIRSRNSMSLPAVTARRPSAWASRRHEDAHRARNERRSQQQAEYRSRARSLEHVPMQERTQAQHNVEKEAVMELDEKAKPTSPSQTLLQGAEERLSRLHLG